MKYKTLPLLCFALITFIAQSGCKKSAPSDIFNTLPPITQQGKLSFGCKVNGEVWVPHYPCTYSIGSPTCTEYHYTIIPDSAVNGGTPSAFYPIWFVLFTGKYINGKWSGFEITQDIHGSFMPNIYGPGNYFDSVNINFSGYHSEPWRAHMTAAPFVFEVTKVDSVKGFISGTFGFTLYNRDPTQGNAIVDSVVITEGRFDLPFNQEYCSCSPF